jgi:hypothetical protein
MASSFKEINRAFSRVLTEQARAIGVFDHPTAKGDGREDLVRRFLSERVGTTFGVTKAEVVDSNGLTSGELDVVIYDQSVASCLSIVGERRIVRVESVVMTIEVKSRLDPNTWADESDRIRDGIGTLTRFFKPGPLLKTALKHAEPAELSPFRDGLSTLDDFQDIPAVASAYFGFMGPSDEAAKNFVETPLIDAICVLGKYTIAKKTMGRHKRANGGEHGRAWRWGHGEDALGAFLQLVENTLSEYLDARSLVLPAPRYYRPKPAESSHEPDVAPVG